MKKLGNLKLKRHSTRRVSEVTAIASEFGNSAKIIRSWLRRQVIAFLHSEFILKHPEQVNENDK
jgi:hypothetical protein